MVTRIFASMALLFRRQKIAADSSPFRLELPQSGSEGSGFLANDGVVVIVGANGTGKSRMGSWIELKSSHRENAHRISAQRSLQFPFSITSGAVELAKKHLYYGRRAYRASLDVKVQERWDQNPDVAFLNDYNELITYLFSEHNEATNLFYVGASKREGAGHPLETKIMKVQRIWEELLPHRELIRSSGAVEAKLRGTKSTYNAFEMSDGERVIFYLVGQCLAAEPSAVVIIDEPESHVHKAIQFKLWDAIEAERPDCQFVYFTHDLEFAASRKNAKRIWLKSFDGEVWSWDEVPQNTGIPDEVFLELLGSRRPILFVEGTQGSLDTFIYTSAFPNYTVVPRDGAAHVISSTAAFIDLRDFHHLQSKGIIDRDHRTEDEVKHLAKKDVFTLEYSEIENVLLSEPVLLALEADLGFSTSKVADVKVYILRKLEQEKTRIISRITAFSVEKGLQKNFNNKAVGPKAISDSLRSITTAVSVESVYQEVFIKVDKVLKDAQYEEALKIYDNKGLLKEVSNKFYKVDLEAHFQRVLRNKKSNELIDAVRSVLPQALVVS